MTMARAIWFLILSAGCGQGTEAIDAGSGADAAAGPRFCSLAQHSFCDDFDDVGRSSVQGAWSGAQHSGTGTLTIDNTIAASPPSSLVMTADLAGNGQAPDTASMTELLSISFTNHVVTLSAKIDAVVLGSNVRIMNLTSADVDVVYRLELDTSDTAAYCAIGDTALGVEWTTMPLPPPPIGTWVPASISVDWGSGTITCTLGSASTSSAEGALLHAPAMATIEAYPFSPAEKPATLRFDDVTIDVE